MNSFLPSRKPAEQAVTVPRAVPAKVFEIATFIALGTIVTGNMELRNGIRVDGQVHGRVEKAGGPDIDEVTVHVSGTGEIHGDIVADNVIVEGRIHGSVRAIKHLIVKGFISGSASYGETVDLSGDIDATITRLGHMEPRDLEHSASAAHRDQARAAAQETAVPVLEEIIPPPRVAAHNEAMAPGVNPAGSRPAQRTIHAVATPGTSAAA